MELMQRTDIIFILLFIIVILITLINQFFCVRLSTRRAQVVDQLKKHISSDCLHKLPQLASTQSLEVLGLSIVCIRGMALHSMPNEGVMAALVYGLNDDTFYEVKYSYTFDSRTCIWLSTDQLSRESAYRKASVLLSKDRVNTLFRSHQLKA